MDLRKLVIDKIEELGVRDAAKFFGVSAGTVSNWSTRKTSPSLEAVELVLGEQGLMIAGPPGVKEQEVTWEGKNVIILQPVYRTLNADTHLTLFINYARYGAEKIGLYQQKRTVIHESRNILTHKFLATKAEWAIMVDDDMILPCGSVGVFNGLYAAGVSEESAGFNAITRIMSHGKDKGIVGALYWGRHRGAKAQCSLGFTSEVENQRLTSLRYSGLLADEWVATGFMRIHRSVFERMKEAIDGGKWPECKPQSEDGWYGFWNPIRVRVGEDVSFCRRAKELGIQSYVDTSLICLHNGDCNYGPVTVK